MALETITVLVSSDEVSPEPVDGVTVRVFDSTGATLITEGVTGAVDPGEVEFSLNGDDPPTTYQLRFSILGGSIVSPQQIQVYSPPSAAPPPGGNAFEITASLFTLSPAPQAHQCRASGVILKASGAPARGVDLHFVYLKSPLVVGDSVVLGERVHARTDKDGYVEVDLIRGSAYLVTGEGLEDLQREVEVPDQTSIHIAHLLFPVVRSVTYDLADPWSLAVDETLTITPTVTASDFRVLEGTAAGDVLYEVEDTAIATVSVSSDVIQITGKSPGTTNLVLTRKDESIVYDPDPGIDGGLIQIIVS